MKKNKGENWENGSEKEMDSDRERIRGKNSVAAKPDKRKWEINSGEMRGRLRQFKWKSEVVPFIIRFFHLPKYMFDNASAKWSSRGKCDVNSGQWFCFRIYLGKCIRHRKDGGQKRGIGQTHYSACQSAPIHNSSCGGESAYDSFLLPRFCHWLCQLLQKHLQFVWAQVI